MQMNLTVTFMKSICKYAELEDKEREREGERERKGKEEREGEKSNRCGGNCTNQI